MRALSEKRGAQTTPVEPPPKFAPGGCTQDWLSHCIHIEKFNMNKCPWVELFPRWKYTC